MSETLEDVQRKHFEKWISSPPYEKSVKRLAERSAWPGQYDDVNVQLGFEAWIESAKCNKQAQFTERLAQRFRYRKTGCKEWEYGVCLPWKGKWAVLAFAGICSFNDDPWEIMGHVLGEVSAFEWIDNDYGWEG